MEGLTDDQCLFISDHISPGIFERLLRPKVIEYLKDYAIGCRDIRTLKLLRSKGVDAYFSGCLTLTLDTGYGKLKHMKSSDKILIVDLDSQALDSLPKNIIENSVLVSNYLFKPPLENVSTFLRRVPQPLRSIIKSIATFRYGRKIINNINFSKAKKFSIEERFKIAEMRLYEIATARLVLTSRLHVALPAIAFGTPVILIRRNFSDPRFNPYLKFIPHHTVEEFREIAHSINYNKPPRNPHQDELATLKRNLVKTVKDFLKEDKN